MNDRLLNTLAKIAGPDGVVAHPTELTVYDCDGYTLEKSVPDLVVLPRSTEEVSAVLRLLHREGIPLVPRGAGTGFSGGCLPLKARVMIGLSRMNRILNIDWVNRRVTAQAGVVNQWITNAVKSRGLYYAPDPSSQSACTIGGNISENSGGPHTLKYGVTTNHVLGLEMVLPDGEIVRLGGEIEDVPGYDLRGIAIGSEGTFGVVTEATLRLSRLPQAYRTLLAIFDSVDAASRTVAGIIGRGIVPAALEMMDNLIIRAVEEAFHFGFPVDAAAALIVEIDGLAAGFDRLTARIVDVCHENGSISVRIAKDEREREELWKCRKKAFGAVGRLAPNYCCQDGVVPPTRLPEIMRAIAAIASRYRLKIGNVFHAGDGNIHPVLLYDERDADETRRVIEAGKEILMACVELGGSLTGEHGIGVEKIGLMPLIFSAEDI
ncbi:MAG: FAD-linked oxidase C-terminal domain-containing protein, partial [Candidatus Binatia bacterium]